mmetsp:Transcript_9846/g.20974  ORF Transcript_9846/g.20974 Transcript_9846/m.20974 type:complete len:338 (+) Transcript_9846:130-1143(+)
MCRAGPIPAKSNNRRMSLKQVLPCEEEQTVHAPLHEKYSIETLSTADVSSQGSCGYHWQPAINSPVTGSFADILDDYHVFPRVIGSGHYGSVRECISRRTREVFAVKTIEKCKIARIDHLRREVSILKKVNHGNVMKMVDCYEDEEYLHIVTEKYSGGELFDKIIENTTAEGCFSEKAAAKIIKSLLEAVVYLHGEGIAHRDIKPENILFESADEESDIKLIDFGLSRKHKRGDSPMSTPVGTAYYMSPELLKGEYDISCDNWSVGIVAYILLSGYPPFNGDTDPDIFAAIKRGHFEFPKQGFSDEAKDFIKSLLRRDPRKRLSAEDALKHPWLMRE